MRLASLIVVSLALAALIGAALAGAQSPAPDPTGRHLLVVPDTARGEAALERTDARVVASYESFALVEAAGADERRLREAGADRRDDMRSIRLGGRSFDPASDRLSLAGKSVDPSGEELVLVQFVGPPKPAWLERLEATGGRVVGYAAQNGYLVHARGPAVERVAALVGTDTAVRAVVPVDGRDKLDGVERGGLVAVQTVAGAPGEDARDEARSLGPSVQRASVVHGVTTQFLRLGLQEIMRLAEDPAVLLVEPHAPATLLDERVSQIAAGNLSSGAPSGPDYLDWLTAKGFTTSPLGFAINVTDEGLDNGDAAQPDHADLYENGLSTGTDRVAFAIDYTADPDARDCGGHGTNVASIAAGYNDKSDGAADFNDTAGFNYGLGVAPQAQVGASKVFECDGDSALNTVNHTNLTAAAYAAGAWITNNSWGRTGSKSGPTIGAYTAEAREYDSLVRDAQPAVGGNQEMVQVFAAGNRGEDVTGSPNEGYASITPPGTAKNVITVGASESVRPISGTDGCGVPDAGANNASDLIDFSSRGPTDDQRLKPDLVAPGTHVVGARPTHGAYTGEGACLGQETFPANTTYNLISGTSQAAPVVAGAAALVRDWYSRSHAGDPPSPALTKAVLLGSATDMAGGADGKGGALPNSPSTDAGWGRVDLGRALDDGPRELVDQSVLLQQGEEEVRSYGVADPNEPVRVTLAWTDAVPAVSGGNAFVNDLDLEVSAGGRRYLGNVFAGGLSRPGGEPDVRNNVESVILPAGTAGRLSVRVIGKTIAMDGVPGSPDDPDQDFALVVSNATEQPSPVFVHDSTEIDDSATAGGNHDGDLEPGESFTLTERITNESAVGATGVQGSLTAITPELTVAGASGYGDVAAGATQPGAPPFTGTLAGQAPCGADALATLQVTSEPGPTTQSVPVVIPTGRPGSTTTRSRTANLSIPDDSSAGVSSPLQVTSAGRIKDVNVTVASLTHGWVGDLVIDITGPDGTRVRLAEHPGGPDNFGNNFTNTVFDDEAATNIGGASAPFSGSFRPQRDSLSRFDGKPQQGTWTLRVRDLSEGDTGTLGNWGTATTIAECDPDTFPPETSIDAGPQTLTNSRTASFAFSSNEAGSTFECKLDGGDFVPCGSPANYGGLADGEHSFEVRAFDGLGHVDSSAAARTWSVDATSPQPTISSPESGSTATRDRPPIAGRAGTAAGDAGTVTVKLFRGTLASGLPAQTLVVPLDGTSGAWAAVPAALAPGTWTARAEQTDAAGNVGVSSAATFRILPAPSFVVGPAELPVGDAVAGRLRLVAACGEACQASAKLTVSRSTARKVGLGKKSPLALGSGAARLSTAGTLALRVGLTPRARAALRDETAASATLRLTLTEGGERLSLRRAVTLRRAGLRSVVRRGLRLWAACTRACPLSGRLTVAPSEARRLGLKRRGSRRVEVASGSVTSSRTGTALTLTVRRAASKALTKARRARLLLEAVAGTAPDLRRTATLPLTLRR